MKTTIITFSKKSELLEQLAIAGNEDVLVHIEWDEDCPEEVVGDLYVTDYDDAIRYLQNGGIWGYSDPTEETERVEKLG